MIIIIYLFKVYSFIFPLLQPNFPFPGNGNPKGPWPGPPPEFPITGGILILLMGALGLGIKTFLKKKKD